MPEKEGPSSKEMGLPNKFDYQETKEEYAETLREIWKSPENTEIIQLLSYGFKRIEDDDRREKLIDFLENFRDDVRDLDVEAVNRFGEGFSFVFPEMPDHPEASGKKVSDVLREIIEIQMGEE